MKSKIILLFILGLAVQSSTIADTFTPSHSCFKPSKPYQFNSEWELSNYNNQVEDYQRCIADFVEEQNEAARRHQEAASDAIDDWNRFVNYEM